MGINGSGQKVAKEVVIHSGQKWSKVEIQSVGQKKVEGGAQVGINGSGQKVAKKVVIHSGQKWSKLVKSGRNCKVVAIHGGRGQSRELSKAPPPARPKAAAAAKISANEEAKTTGGEEREVCVRARECARACGCMCVRVCGGGGVGGCVGRGAGGRGSRGAPPAVLQVRRRWPKIGESLTTFDPF